VNYPRHIFPTQSVWQYNSVKDSR